MLHILRFSGTSGKMTDAVESPVHAVSCKTDAGGARLLTDPFLVLGIDVSASDLEIDEAFRYLSKHLNPTNFPSGSIPERQAQQCMSRIVPAYQRLRDPGAREKAQTEALADRARPFNPDDLKPFLGHLCVAAGIISIDD